MKFIMHIGLPKTGTTSIQRFLEKNKKNLKKEGFFYLGRFFENLDKNFKFKGAKYLPIINKLPMKKAKHIFDELLEESLKEAENKSYKTLILSHESFYGKYYFFSSLKKLMRKNIDLKIVIYFRSPKSFIQSAYKQWGIKHKTYKGKVVSFRDFFEKKFNVKYFYNDYLDKLINHGFKNNLILRNFDYIEDVVSDFLKIVEIKNYHNNIKANTSSSDEEFLLRLIFNSLYEEEVTPELFYKSFKNIRFMKAEQFLSNYYPKREEVEYILNKLNLDIDSINLMLTKFKEKPLKEDFSVKSPQIDESKLLFALIQIVMQQQKKILSLEDTIKKIKDKK